MTIPKGAIMGFIHPSFVLDGMVILDSSDLPREGDMADIFAVVGTTFGHGDYSTTFGMPDYNQFCIAPACWAVAYRDITL